MFAGPPFSELSACVIANVAQPCVACHHTSGLKKTSAITTPAANHRLSTRPRPPGIASAQVARTTAKMATRWLSSAPIPVTAPLASHHRVSPVRPIRTATRARAAQARSM